LREELRLIVKYLGVTFASIPAGLIYVLCPRVIGNQNTALVISVSIGLFLAYLVWSLLDEKTLLSPASLEVAAPRRATDLDKLLDDLITTKLGINPGEVTTEYAHDWRQRDLYLREDFAMARKYGHYAVGRNAKFRAEIAKQRDIAEAFFRALSVTTQPSAPSTYQSDSAEAFFGALSATTQPSAPSTHQSDSDEALFRALSMATINTELARPSG
jgi:hypothetical protein